jgi:hypothetical protein
MSSSNLPQSLWVYEVTVTVQPEIIEEYSQVVKSHMEIISALPGFHPIPTCHQIEATETPADQSVTWVIRYFADSRAAIQGYFDTLAPELRQHTTQYADKVAASRRILHPALA